MRPLSGLRLLDDPSSSDSFLELPEEDKKALIKQALLDLSPEAVRELRIALSESDGKDKAKIALDILNAAGIQTQPVTLTEQGSIAAAAVAGAIKGMAQVFGVETDLPDMKDITLSTEPEAPHDRESPQALNPPSYDKSFITGLKEESDEA